MPAPEEISKLVQRYKNNRDQYRSSGYKETELRREFLDPLFKALGWDVDNTQDFAEQYKEVVHEKSLEVEGDTRAPDYAFRIGGTTKFFMEAKKPSVDITTDKKPAFQLKRYAWSAKLPLSVLTNFEDLSVYDCRYKPDKNDIPSKSRILYISWDDLEVRWDELCAIFTKEAIMKGSFDKYAQEKKRGTSEVDDEILKDIEGWREELAKNIAIRNPDLSIEEMNFAVQRIIDRILFLRICEDRGTEPEEQLYKLLDKGIDIYRNLIDIFQLADIKYNSGLFHFTHDKTRGTKPDRITPHLAIDDKIIAGVIWDLYYPNSPYQFDVVPADILGQVYEQFLGKVIRLTEGHHAKVEEKPEVKKAGGVFYTPSYIVDYIVENTVVKLCEGKTPDEMKELKILDPACGSGSFLIVAYKKLMDKHLDWYTANNPKKFKAAIFQNDKGAWQLTLQEKKKILLSCIHGVDIDVQAVEVTKLNLLLKALEGENKESLENVNKLFKEPALPDLANNIKCGNSLVSSDISAMLTDLPPEQYEAEIARINPFDWSEEFPDVFKGGGFDAVIGNPPYVRQETLGELKNYLQVHYRTYHGMADLFTYFIEKGVGLLNENGLWGNIVANKWMRANYGQPLRKWLKLNHIIEILDFGDLKVFTTATTYPCIMILGKGKPVKQFDVVNFKTLEPMRLKEIIRETKFQMAVSSLDDAGWALLGGDDSRLLEKLKKVGKPLGEYVDGKIYRGVLTGLNEAFVINEETRSRLIKEDKKSAEVIKPFLVGKDIKRYLPIRKRKYIIFVPWHFPLHKDNLISGVSKIAEQEFQKQYPAIYNHLLSFKCQLQSRNKSETGIRYEWYALQRYASSYYQEFEKPKIIYAEIAQRGQYTIDYDYSYSDTTSYILGCDDKYLLGILNSKLWTYLFSNISSEIRGGFFRWKHQYVEKLPIRTIDFTNKEDVARHDKMVELVERMLKLHKDIKEAKTPDAETRIQRQIEATDKEIDRLVYELYGLMEEEIKIIEGVE